MKTEAEDPIAPADWNGCIGLTKREYFSIRIAQALISADGASQTTLKDAVDLADDLIFQLNIEKP